MSFMNWKDPETKQKLLLSILASQDEDALKGSRANQIAIYMGCTPKAVTHQLTALRKELDTFKTNGTVSTTPSASKASTASPQKRKSNKAAGDESADAHGDGDANSDAEGESPKKKVKAKTTPKKPAGKKVAAAKKAKTAESDSGDEKDDEQVAARKDKADGVQDEKAGDTDEESG